MFLFNSCDFSSRTRKPAKSLVKRYIFENWMEKKLVYTGTILTAIFFKFLPRTLITLFNKLWVIKNIQEQKYDPVVNFGCWIQIWTPFLHIRSAFFNKCIWNFSQISPNFIGFLQQMYHSRSCCNYIVKFDMLNYECKCYYKQEIE